MPDKGWEGGDGLQTEKWAHSQPVVRQSRAVVPEQGYVAEGFNGGFGERGLVVVVGAYQGDKRIVLPRQVLW